MSRIRVARSESPGHRRAREQRQRLNQVTTELVSSWRERGDDPFMVEVLRGLVLARSIDDAHPVDRQGRCTRWRCTRRWLFIRRRCPLRVTLGFCRTADTAVLWFYVVTQFLKVDVTLDSVRSWLAQCHTSTPQTDEPTTTPSAAE